jgi:hypothetical protein
MGSGTLESEFLPGCSIRIDVDGSASGSGFFVTAKDVVTCRHVIDDATEIEVFDRLGNSHPVNETPVVADNSDLAWIKLEAAEPRGPVALLDAIVDTGDELYSFGYPEDNSGEPATFEIEGLTGDVPPRIKFKAGQVRPGMSGSPMLNRRTGAICAVLVSTRGRQSSLGGYGVPVSTLLSLPSFRDLCALNASAYASDPRWMNALTDAQKECSPGLSTALHSSPGIITQVSDNARVGKIVNIGDINGSVSF